MMESIGETSQVSAGNEPSNKGQLKTPLKVHPNRNGSAVSAGLSAEKKRAAESGPPQTIAEKNWRRCLERYEFETAHEEFFHFICQSRNFSFGIHCYRELLTLQGTDAVAEKMIQRLYAAMQVYWHQSDVEPKTWLVRKKWLLMGLAIVAVILFMGLRYEEHRPLLGLGFAGLLLVMGLNSKWISRL